tara:strand:- start:2022 stop:2429 length:408 start_codon:yes stop_codon:yes gene_type:complete
MKLNVRNLRDEDYKTISKWWKQWQWPVIPKYNLPPTGLIVEKDGVSIVSCYIYMTNSPGALLEWIVSNPDYRDKDRQQAIELLITTAEDILKKEGVAYMFSIGRNKHLIDTHKKLGWHIEQKPSQEMTKAINLKL